jgi:ribose-phosphate pyrophosphokinase
MQVSTKKRLILLTGEANRPLADEIAAHLGMKLGVLETAQFADSQTYARLAESVRGADAFIIQSICDPVDHFIMQQLIVIDALKRASAKRITAVCPLYPYSRQDRKARGREPITAKLMADIYEAAGVDRMVSVDLHSGQIQGFFDVPFDHLTAMPVLAEHFEDLLEGEFVIVSPDAGGVRLADKWVQHLAEFHDLHGQVAFLHKRRRKDVRNVSETKTVVGEVKGKICLVVDDMIDTAGTLVNGSDLLIEAGATKVYAAATHGLLSGPAIDRIKNSQIEQVVVTNTLPLSDDKRIDKIEVVSIAPLIGDTIQAVFEEDSVSNLFHGKNEP